MYTVNINHKGQKEATTYTVYRKEEAEKEGIRYVYWKMVQPGGYALSDDDYVAKCINRKEYPSNHDKDNVYLRFPWGYTFFNPKYASKKLNVSGRKTNTTMSGKPMLEVKSKQDMMKNLAKAYSVTWDYNLALDMVLGTYTPSEFKKWKRMMKTEVFSKMIKEELADLLSDHGLDKTYTLDLFAQVITMAKDKKDVTNLLRAVENLQGMHGMKEKSLVKTTESIEAVSNVKLIDELREEEDKLIATKTTTTTEE
jgi:hypothetical protein|tara:strand:+ start:6410 stop:7171 length:762 start_codon:yes stop_codon:yes gene_type:complete